MVVRQDAIQHEEHSKPLPLGLVELRCGLILDILGVLSTREDGLEDEVPILCEANSPLQDCIAAKI